MKLSKSEQKQYYVDYVLDAKKEAKDAEKDLRDKWEELWMVYQSRQDNTVKADWQSKTFAPKIFMQIEKSAGEIKRAVMQTRKLFKFEFDDFQYKMDVVKFQQQLADCEDSEQMGAIQKHIVETRRAMQMKREELALLEEKFKLDLKKTNLTNVYSLMVKSAFLLGIGVPKVLWSPKMKAAKFEHVDRMNTFISPEYHPFQQERPPYIIEYKRMPLARLKKLAKDASKAGAKGWDLKAIRDLEEDSSAAESKTKERERKGLSGSSKHKKEVEILEFWGDVIDKDDTDVEENLLLVIVNDKYLIRKQVNPFKHGKTPYPLAYPLPYPHRGQAGTSLSAPLITLQYAYNNVLNMWIDNLNFTVNKVFQYDATNLEDPKSLTNIYPGKKIQVNGDVDAIKEIAISNVGHEPRMAMESIDREMQEGSNVTEFVSGFPGSKSKTLGEVEIKTAQARGMFDVIARDLEENNLKVVLEMAYDLYEQFAGYPPREGYFSISVGGVSLQLLRQELIKQMQEVIAIALQSEELHAMTDIKDLWKKFLSLYNLDDVYIVPSGMSMNMRPEQTQAIAGKAEQDAKAAVSKMSPEQIKKMAG